jgi:hypothetical protein
MSLHLPFVSCLLKNYATLKKPDRAQNHDQLGNAAHVVAEQLYLVITK